MGWIIPELDRSLDKYFVALIPEEEKVRDPGLNPDWSLLIVLMLHSLNPPLSAGTASLAN
jgi:hypothetical protein